jgi:heme oxygenase
MKVFGFGTLSSMSSLEQYQRFVESMYVIYSTMEQELDETNGRIWQEYGDRLRRTEAIRLDWMDVNIPSKKNHHHVPIDELPIEAFSIAAQKYRNAIRAAGIHDRATNSATLLGHLYCRYFADLFGGQMLGRPYRYALSLPETPRHYQFGISSVHERQRFIEELYSAINIEGKKLNEEQFDDVITETRKAFELNIQVYKEIHTISNAWQGASNLLIGYSKQIFS